MSSGLELRISGPSNPEPENLQRIKDRGVPFPYLRVGGGGGGGNAESLLRVWCEG